MSNVNVEIESTPQERTNEIIPGVQGLLVKADEECGICNNLGANPNCPSCGRKGPCEVKKDCGIVVCPMKSRANNAPACKKTCTSCRGYQYVMVTHEVIAPRKDWTSKVMRPLNRAERRRVLKTPPRKFF